MNQTKVASKEERRNWEERVEERERERGKSGREREFK